MTSHWTAGRFYCTALLFGVVYVFITPLFTVPDEIAHFWRASAVARGKVLPAPRPAPVAFEVDEGIRLFVWHIQTRLAPTRRYESGTVAEANRIRHMGVDGPASFTAIYTPLSYAPQAVASAVTTALRLRPLIMFYLGRVANLMFWMAVVAAAIRLAPACAPMLAAVALLPMNLFQFASWSADAAAIALAMLVTALAVRAATASHPISAREMVAFSAVAFLLTLCKPVYFLLPALALAIPQRRFRSGARRVAMLLLVAAVTVAGTAISMTYFNRGYSNIRTDLPVDPAAQKECIRHAPMRFAGAVGGDLGANWRFYREQIIGRFGPNEIKIPMAAVWLAWLILAAVAATTSPPIGVPFRLGGIAIVAATVFGIVASQYIIWSVVCGDTVEGVQGRYFLPILPLLGIVLGGFIRRPLPPLVLLIGAIVWNAAAFGTILIWYA